MYNAITRNFLALIFTNTRGANMTNLLFLPQKLIILKHEDIFRTFLYLSKSGYQFSYSNHNSALPVISFHMCRTTSAMFVFVSYRELKLYVIAFTQLWNQKQYKRNIRTKTKLQAEKICLLEWKIQYFSLFTCDASPLETTMQ